MDFHRPTSRSILKYSRFSRSVLFQVARTQICGWYLTRWDAKKSDFKTPDLQPIRNTPDSLFSIAYRRF
jgi:hypothetical protein